MSFLIVALLIALVSLYDVSSARADPETYERVYHMPVAEKVAQSYRSAGVSAVALVVPLLMFVDRKRRRIWRALVLGGAAIWVVFVAYSLWAWAATGFDH